MNQDSSADRARLRAIVGATGIFGLFPLSLSPLIVAAAQKHLGLSTIDAGILATALLAGVSAAAFALGAGAGRLPIRRTYTAGLLLVAVAQALMLLFPSKSLAVLCAGWFVSGIGSGCGVVVGDITLARTRNPMMTAGVGMAITSVLMLCVFPLGTYLIATVGFHAVSMMSLGSVAAGFVLLLGLDLDGLVPRAPGTRRAQGGHLGLPVLALVVSIGFFWIRDGMIWSFSASAAERLGIAEADVGLLLGVAGICGVLGCCVSAWVSRSGVVRKSTVLYAVALAAVVSSLWALAANARDFTILQLAYNALQLFTYPLMLGFAAQVDPSGRLAAFSGGMTLFGAAAGPVISGLAVEQWGHDGLVIGVGVVNLVSVLAFLVAIQNARQGLAGEPRVISKQR